MTDDSTVSIDTLLQWMEEPMNTPSLIAPLVHAPPHAPLPHSPTIDELLTLPSPPQNNVPHNTTKKGNNTSNTTSKKRSRSSSLDISSLFDLDTTVSMPATLSSNTTPQNHKLHKHRHTISPTTLLPPQWSL